MRQIGKFGCSESLHFVGLATSACLFTSPPRPSCTADSSAALGATVPVRSCHVPHLCNLYCYCLSQPLPSLSFSVHISHSITRFPVPSPTSPPRFPYAFLTALCPFWHICCLATGFERLPLVRLPFWRYRWNRLILYYQRAQKHSNLTFFYVSLHHTKAHQKHVRTAESTQCPT
jgi:hypothetical protein